MESDLKIPEHWVVPNSTLTRSKVDARILAVNESEGFLCQVWKGVDPENFAWGEYFFKPEEGGLPLSLRERKIGAIKICLQRDTPVEAYFFEDPDLGFMVSFRNFLSDNPSVIASLNFGSISLEEIHLSTMFLDTPGLRIASPGISILPVFDQDYKLAGLYPDHKTIIAREHTSLLPIKEYEHYLLDGEENFEITLKVQNGIAVIEQTYMEKDRPGYGITKIIRVDTNQIDLAKATELANVLSYEDREAKLTDIPQARWRDVLQYMGEPMVSYKGPLKEFLKEEFAENHL
jgi:hypothetical protein